MICFARTCDVEGIINLWNEAFGDSRDDITAFLKNYLDCVLLYKKENTVCGMLTLMPVTLNGEKGRYIYAVAVLKKHRSCGISTKLIEYVKNYIKENNEKFCVLVPASESLFEYYEKRGFYKLSCVDKIEWCREEYICTDEIIEIIDAYEYHEMRKNILGNNIVEWSSEDLENIRYMYNGEFCKISNCNAAYFAVRGENELIIKELCCKKENVSEILSILGKNGEYKKIHAVIYGDKPFAMIYPDIKDVYFNIALD